MKNKYKKTIDNTETSDCFEHVELVIEFLSINNNICTLEGKLISPAEKKDFQIVVDDGTRLFIKKTKPDSYDKNMTCNQCSFIMKYTIEFQIENGKEYQIKIKTNSRVFIPKNITFGKNISLSSIYKYMYIKNQGYLITHKKNTLIINKEKLINKIINNLKFHLDLLIPKHISSDLTKASLKSLVIRPLVYINRLFKRKPLWVFRDRTYSADDNGIAMFEYINENHKEINSIFAISKDINNATFKKIKGKTVDALSLKYKILYLVSDYVLSSSADDDAVRPFEGHDEPFKDLECSVRKIFLQHGVTKDDISKWLNKYEMNFYGFVCVSKKERKSIIEGNYGYKENNVWLTGFPRYDRLQNSRKKIIIIAPTWRGYLVGKKTTNDHRELNNNYINSNYFKTYNSLLNNKELASIINNSNYKLIFYSHPVFKEHSYYFENKNNYIIDPDMSYNEIICSGSLLITDYSSVAFDFAYLNKPLLYYQFDEEIFFENHGVYTKGYFSYENDGFGHIIKNEKELIVKIKEYINNDCMVEKKYIKRAQAFFEYHDCNNCKRLYETICDNSKNQVHNNFSL